MKPSDLYFVGEGFVPFYRVPLEHVVQVYTRWRNSEHIWKDYQSNFLKKVDGNSGVMSGHHGGKTISMDQRELVRDITDENFETHSS